MKKEPQARLNIYVPSKSLRRLVKAAAAKHDLSVSEYCVQAITDKLKGEGEAVWGEPARSSPGQSAVSRARRFITSTFKGHQFAVSSADLIRDARSKRSANA